MSLMILTLTKNITWQIRILMVTMISKFRMKSYLNNKIKTNMMIKNKRERRKSRSMMRKKRMLKAKRMRAMFPNLVPLFLLITKEEKRALILTRTKLNISIISLKKMKKKIERVIWDQVTKLLLNIQQVPYSNRRPTTIW